jgi:hypothetical protein
MRRRKRLRKKLHRKYLTTVCGWVLTFDDSLRDQLLVSEAGTGFPIVLSRHRGMRRLMLRWTLRYSVAVIHQLAPQTATIAYWAQEFPAIKDEAVIFSTEDFKSQAARTAEPT